MPLGLGITKLRLWDELHSVYYEGMHSASHSSSSSSIQGNAHDDSATTNASSQKDLKDLPSSTLRYLGTSRDLAPTPPKKRRTEPSECLLHVSLPSSAAARPLELGEIGSNDLQASYLSRFQPVHNEASSSIIDDALSTSSRFAEPARDSQGVLMPPPPPLPGPSRRTPPPLVARIKARARRAKRKQQKAEYRRRLFLAHLVQVTRAARRRGPASLSSEVSPGGEVAASGSAVKITKTSTAQQAIQQAWLLFPECLGVDLGSFVEIVFDTDAQSSEITAPSDISDDDLAEATRIEIENRQRLGGADVQVPRGVFRWMVARDFAERWPQKMQHVRDNPWPGLEHLWGSPSGSATSKCKAMDVSLTKGRGGDGKENAEPIRWQSGPRSRFIRKKEMNDPKKPTMQEKREDGPFAAKALVEPKGGRASSRQAAGSQLAAATGDASMDEMAYLQAVRQSHQPPRDFGVMHGALPMAGESFQVEHEQAPASLKQRSDTPAQPPLTFDTATGSWTWTSVNSCSHAATVRSSTAGVPIRL